jgi:hypothetical protein
MAAIDVAFDLGVTDPSTPLTLSVWFDGRLLRPQHTVPALEHVRFNLAMPVGQHELIWRMQGKTAAHTLLSPQGQIEKDASLLVHNICLGGVAVDGIMAREACYHHDYNGHAPATCERYHGVMGCNGEVRLRFSTPLYMWLLEHR